MSFAVADPLERLDRQLTLRTLGLYATIFLLFLAVVGWLVFHDLDRRTINEDLVKAHGLATGLAQELATKFKLSGPDARVRFIQERVQIGKLLDQETASISQLVERITIVSERGEVMLQVKRDARGRATLDLDPEQLPARSKSPDAPPDTTAGRPIALVERPRVVEVPLGQNLGRLLLAMPPTALEQETAQVRRELMIRLLIGGGILFVLLLILFLYTLSLLRRTRTLEAQRQRAEQLSQLGALASGLAHEIRNPLNAMNLNLEMLEEELETAGGDAQSVDLVRSSRAEVLRLERLVQDVLDFARPRPAMREEIAPGELVADVVRFMRSAFDAAGVGLELQHEDGTPLVRVDAGQIRQALINILQNALQVSRSGDLVRVVVGPTEFGEARIDVQDRGPGIKPEERGRIFEVFWSTRPAGTGLGLPIAQRVVEFHGGRIDVESTPGQGSTFRLVLPASIATSTGPVPKPQTAAGA